MFIVVCEWLFWAIPIPMSEKRNRSNEAARARQRVNQRRWYACHRDEIVTRQRAARAAEPDRFREHGRRSYWGNPEKFRARVRAWKRKRRTAGQTLLNLPMEPESGSAGRPPFNSAPRVNMQMPIPEPISEIADCESFPDAQIPGVHRAIQTDPNGRTEFIAAVDFDYGKVDEALGFIRDASPDARAEAAEILGKVIAYCFGPTGRLRQACVRFVVLAAGLRPDLLQDRTYEQLGRELGVTKQSVSKCAIRVSKAFGIQFARGRLPEARQHMAEARRGGPYRGEAARSKKKAEQP
jgi:hypothetical protein